MKNALRLPLAITGKIIFSYLVNFFMIITFINLYHILTTQMTSAVPPIFGKSKFKNTKGRITSLSRKHGDNFVPRRNLWRHSMLRLLPVLLRRWSLSPSLNQQFPSFSLKLQTPWRWCLTKCSPQSIHSWGRSPCLWWLWSRKCKEVKHLSNRWLSFSQPWLTLPKSSNVQRNFFHQWTFLVKHYLH